MRATGSCLRHGGLAAPATWGSCTLGGWRAGESLGDRQESKLPLEDTSGVFTVTRITIHGEHSAFLSSFSFFLVLKYCVFSKAAWSRPQAMGHQQIVILFNLWDPHGRKHKKGKSEGRWRRVTADSSLSPVTSPSPAARWQTIQEPEK